MTAAAGCHLCMALSVCSLQHMQQMKQSEQTTGRTLTQSRSRLMWTHRDMAPDRCRVKSVWEKGVRHIQSNVASCISHWRSSSNSSTWTEPPSRSAVRCDPKVSLLVTGVGWNSLPLGSGDLTQRAKGVEAGGDEVVRKSMVGERRSWGEGRSSVGRGGEKLEVWRNEGQGGGEWIKKKKQKQKKL